jgi:uncharacterized protein (DUF1697 family)
MTVFISMLRGINLGGHNKIQMTGLISLYQDLGFNGVSSYIQSGNILFETKKKISDLKLEQKIAQALLRVYQLEIPVIIRSREEFKKIVSINPFLGKKGILTEKLHISFLSEVPDPANLKKLDGLVPSPDKFILIGREVYLYCPGGYGVSRLTNNFFENKLKVKATTRNWNTANKLLELAESR